MTASSQFVVIIPARFGSTRLPGKPLLSLAGRPMIEHVYRRGLESGAQRVVIATDDARIAKVVEQFGGEAVMTATTHVSGTDRLAEVAHKLALSDDTIVVNLQGDEPLMEGRLIARMAEALVRNPDAGISTLAAPLHDASDLFNTNVVKVVLDARGFALYFSRAPIPWVRDSYSLTAPPTQLSTQLPVLRHFGLYGYRVDALRKLAAHPVVALEAAESLEQLRALYSGTRIFVELTDDPIGRGVDTADDVPLVESLLRARASS